VPRTGDKGYRKIRLLGGYFSTIKIVIIHSELARALGYDLRRKLRVNYTGK